MPAEEPLAPANEPEEEQQAAAEAQQHEEEEQKESEEAAQQEEEDEPRDPGSSMVAEWGYNRDAEEVEVTFQNGKTESYPCDPQTWAAATEAVSAGKFMHANFL